MYFEKLSRKPIEDKIDEGTYLIGVQVNEEGEEVVSRYPAEAIEGFKNEKAEEAQTKAEEAQTKAEEAAEEAQATLKEVRANVTIIDGVLCAVFEEEDT